MTTYGAYSGEAPLAGSWASGSDPSAICAGYQGHFSPPAVSHTLVGNTCTIFTRAGTAYGAITIRQVASGGSGGDGGGGDTGGSTSQVTLEPAPLSEERAADMLQLFWLFVLALVMVWGWKQILNIFTSNGD